MALAAETYVPWGLPLLAFDYFTWGLRGDNPSMSVCLLKYIPILLLTAISGVAITKCCHPD